MESNKLSSWLNLGANLGVLIGIIVVVLELQQNRVAIQSQTRSNISSEAAEDIRRWAEHPTLLDIQYRARQGEELTPVEDQTLGRFTRGQFRRWENTHYQYRQGLYSEEEFQGSLLAWKSIMSDEVTQEIWGDSSQIFSPDFSSIIDGLIEN